MKTRSTGRTSSGIGGIDQFEIGGVGVDHAAARVGDQDAVGRPVDHGLDQRARRLRVRRSRSMPAASANSRNTPTIASTASSARM